MENINWFRVEFEPHLSGYETKYRFYEKGDFGTLNQVEFNKDDRGGEVDFWSSGHIGIHFVNYRNAEALLIAFLEPKDALRRKHAFEALRDLL